jgi:head-tail adaptor
MGTGDYRHRVAVQNKSDVPDGGGGYVEAWTDSDPPWHVSITPYPQKHLEFVEGATVVAEATHEVRGRWRDDLTSRSRIVFQNRIMNVVAVVNPTERPIELMVRVMEMVP